MSTNTASRMGLFPQILPVTGTFLTGFGLLQTFLSIAVVRARLSTNTLHGDKQTSSTDLANDPVHLTSRTFSNFTEHVPMLLLMSSVIEINGGNRTYLTYGLATFMALRLSHVFGFGQGVIAFRAAGYYGSTALGAIMALWSGYLSKSYWGF